MGQPGRSDRKKRMPVFAGAGRKVILDLLPVWSPIPSRETSEPIVVCSWISGRLDMIFGLLLFRDAELFFDFFDAFIDLREPAGKRVDLELLAPGAARGAEDHRALLEVAHDAGLR